MEGSGIAVQWSVLLAMLWDVIGHTQGLWFNSNQDFYILGANALAQIINMDKVRAKAT